MKKASKQAIDKNNYNRILLTELLPYEIPVILNNEGFYNKKDTIFNQSKMLCFLFQEGRETYPLNYKIIKIGSDTRTLYLMHPSNQKDFVAFYKKYSSLICHLTLRSKYSLRAPTDVASWYYEPSLKLKENGLKDEDVETYNNDEVRGFKYASSFFVYKKYSFLYKFYDSYEFHRLEKKYKKLLKFDISKCFDNISTRRLAECVKDENYAKTNRGAQNFENRFIHLMESANFGRNDGILIGPEISRIFAEIILQKIDKNVYLENKNTDFEVRRYVDDYFLFYNDEKIGMEILTSFKCELEKIKLFLNESKIEYFDAPFLTGTSMAKKDLQDVFSRLFDTFDESRKNKKEDSDADFDDDKVTFIKYNKNPGLAANKLIRDIKAIVIKNDTKFESIVGYFFTTVKNKLHEVLQYTKDLDEEQSENITKFVKVITDVAFFVYSMDKRVRSTFLISQISILCYRIAINLSYEYKTDILKKIQDELIFIIKNGHEASPQGIELINLVIVFGSLGEIHNELTSQEICWFLFDCELAAIEDMNYFHIISILYYIKNNDKYMDLYNKSIQIAINKLTKYKCSIYSESAHLFLDLMACPYLSKGLKKKIIQTVSINEFDMKMTASELGRELKILSLSDWFVDWSSDGVSIERLLLKKELKSAYE
ncbi:MULTISPECIES: antiviral reverse transcriptase Drt3b [Enterobacter cloacae complex]|uniref:antiviral reverse transcriptase Drt3b n=2 Tax=Enterobacter TaxID=547 RepID=UPI0018C26660|nr:MULTISPECIES: antiviral reverse transcriptase Drt3b [Enterobacter cloacae complex]EKT9190944.1 RNA-directed DNA polymerase [Enterobacter cloacae]EKU3859148.1 RNA-directed DNA polymerase [Enterobacter cloacae]EKX9063641.1 RNA-directed DNA polymerase [Enterobacter cloacae]ELR9204498.1 RNA-directed DNA polymerase [Enterobacter cloacae]MBG0523380.1 RNA-directed DNA polymerase [Enterobacter cloacae]